MQLRRNTAKASVAESVLHPDRSFHAAGLRLFAHESGGGEGALGAGSVTGTGTTTGDGSAQVDGQLAGAGGLLFGTLAQLLNISASNARPTRTVDGFFWWMLD
jgi:hypothetical protein